MPYEYGKLKTGSTLSLQNPELQQLNVDKMVISPIPLDKYSELIDGRSITFVVPQIDTVSTMSAKTIVSSTYHELTKYQNSPLLGNNIAFLFSDDINLPRTGSTLGTNTTSLPRTTWNETPFVNRPQAHAYSDLDVSDINTDTRHGNGIHWISVFIDASNLPEISIEFYDSVAPKNSKGERKVEKEILEFMDKIYEASSRRFCLSSGKECFLLKPVKKINKKSIQRKNSECGVYSCWFISQRLKGYSHEKLDEEGLPDDIINYFRCSLFTNFDDKFCEV